MPYNNSNSNTATMKLDNVGGKQVVTHLAGRPVRGIKTESDIGNLPDDQMEALRGALNQMKKSCFPRA